MSCSSTSTKDVEMSQSLKTNSLQCTMTPGLAGDDSIEDDSDDDEPLSSLIRYPTKQINKVIPNPLIKSI